MANQTVERSACAKIILCGEHAVVYGRPAIALPLAHPRSRAVVAPGNGIFHICAPDIRTEFDLTADTTRPLAIVARMTFEWLRQPAAQATLTITSEIPASAHLGSSASVAVAAARAIAAYCGSALEPGDASRLAFEAEKIYHGSPSGIDNTVIAYEQPVWYVKAPKPGMGGLKQETAPAIDLIALPQAPVLVIADTGIAMSTRVSVGDVRARWEADPPRYERLFDQIGVVVTAARAALQAGDWACLGGLLNENHTQLQALGVSCAELDRLCASARQAGALGAKLSGGGRGGNMIALARDAQHAEQIRIALRNAGATRVI